MPKNRIILVICTIVVMLIAASCTPKPAPTPTPATPAPTSTPAPGTTPVTGATDDAWAKIVAAAKKEGNVTIYSTSFIADIGKRISDEFRKTYGIQVDNLVGNGGTLLQKILVEQSMKGQIADIFLIGGAGSTSDLILRGGAESVAKDLPVLKDKSVFKVDPVYSPGGEGLVWILAYSGVNINTDLIKPADYPKSYKDFLDPKWKGKLLTQDPLTTGGAAPFYYVPRFYKVTDVEYYRQIAKNDVKIWGGNPREAAMMVARGEYYGEIGNSTDTVGPIMGAGAPLKTLPLVEGVTGQLGNTVVVKGAPHPNAARVFTNWLLSAEGQR
ncbi:MAG: extracellular solute-binding protein, partial [Dehalococcoidia bacterium]|nr:extracellular solute-binding protein [Dehalococcoidia bacterium]